MTIADERTDVAWSERDLDNIAGRPEPPRRALFPDAPAAIPRTRPTVTPAEPLPRRRRPTPLAITIALIFIGYVVAALWLRYGIGYTMVDAMSRAANARYMLFGRDAHLGALSFYWMPLPTVFQVPFLLVLEPFGASELASPLSTAACMTGAAWCLGRICRTIGLGRLWEVLLPLAFAINPVAVFYAANGMSEACLFLFLALSLWAFTRVAVQASMRNLVFLSGAVTGLALSRYEALPAALAIAAGAVLVDLRRRRWRKEALSTAALSFLPMIWALMLWFIAQWVIVGSPFYFLRVGAQTSSRSEKSDAILPAVGNVNAAYEYGLRWTMAHGPLLVLAPLLVLLAFHRAGWVRALTFAAAAGSFPAATIYLLVKGGTLGDPRYFTSALVFSAVLACWLGALPGPRVARPVWRLLLVLALALSGIPATIALSDSRETFATEEFRFFSRVSGRPAPGNGAGCPDAAYEFNCDTQWRAVTDALDRELDRTGGRVLVDTRFTWHVPVYTRHPGSFIVNSDRDYTLTLSIPEGRIDYLVVRPPLGPWATDYARQMFQFSPPGTWGVVLETPTATLYRLVDRDAELPFVVPA